MNIIRIIVWIMLLPIAIPLLIFALSFAAIIDIMILSMQFLFKDCYGQPPFFFTVEIIESISDFVTDLFN